MDYYSASGHYAKEFIYRDEINPHMNINDPLSANLFNNVSSWMNLGIDVTKGDTVKASYFEEIKNKINDELNYRRNR